tara:strand:+ start:634 stop:1236 length:603 start_codon:yes stop_codon:yes gene_type:complete
MKNQTNYVVFFDFETDGLPGRGGCLGYPVQMTFQVVNYETRKIVKTYNKFIKGARYISNWVKEHTKVKSLGVLEYGESFEDAMNEMMKYSGLGYLWCAHNLEFDINVILNHAKHFVDIKKVRNQYTLCTCLSTTEFCKLPKTGKAAIYYPKGYKWPKLSELSSILGIHFDENEAHDSLYDVEKLRDCFFKCVDRGIISVL